MISQHDTDSAGPPHATAVLVLNLSPLAATSAIRRHFSSYGPIVSFEPQMNQATGAALGIVYIKFAAHDAAVQCARKEHGKTGATGFANDVRVAEGEEMRVVLDGEGRLLRAVMKEVEGRARRREREEKERKGVERALNGVVVAATSVAEVKTVGVEGVKVKEGKGKGKKHGRKRSGSSSNDSPPTSNLIRHKVQVPGVYPPAREKQAIRPCIEALLATETSPARPAILPPSVKVYFSSCNPNLLTHPPDLSLFA